MKYGINIFRVFQTTHASSIEKIIFSIMFVLPIEIVSELTNYYVKNLAASIVTLSKSIFFELAMLGLDATKISVKGSIPTWLCTVALLYLPKLYDSVMMIIYGIRKKNYYRDAKWYGVKYYAK